MDADRQDVLELDARAVDHVMCALDVAPAPVWVRPDIGVALVQVTEHLAGLYGECDEHGPAMTILALLDGRLLQLGTVADAEELGRAIAGHPGLDGDEAGRLLAGYQTARVG